MAQITAALVKELRERTGSGMMECKRALQETNGDIEAAIEHLRKTGQAKADKKADRVAAEGQIVIHASADGRTMAMVEVNCETDFVAKDDNFKAFAEAVAECVVAQGPADVEALSALQLSDGRTVDEARRDLIAKIGENIQVRRFSVINTENGLLNSYSHGGRIGVVVELNGGDTELAKDIAMHVAASRPLCVSAEQVPADIITKEREIYRAQAMQENKPADIIEKMVEGRVRKYLKEVTLLGQPFVKNPDQSIEKLLAEAKASVVHFERMELGEGIEKKVDNFAEEVMAQARGA
ncbi:MAG: elongation factor Ts [Candidatus Competibacteraceae bacterium]|nr:elongation factor Ts [Candidatus Competibacteraceae bacterium]